MSTTAAEKPTLGVPQRPFARAAGGVVGGVCQGLAIRFGVRERTVRIVFCLVALVGGVGLFCYVALWLAVPRAGEDRAIAARLVRHRGVRQSALAGIGAVLVVLVAARAIGFGRPSTFAWMLGLSVAGFAGVWKGASPEERARLDGLFNATPVLGAASTSRSSVLVRLGAGVALIVVGLDVLSRVGGIWGAAVPALVGALVVIGGVLVLGAPWWLKTVRDLANERNERVRAEERATMATHLHDSVLQTLTLIERVAHDPSAVRRIARGQERELRQWLFDPGAADGRSRASFAAAARTIEADIDRDYGVRVETVVVGDCQMDEDLEALVAAGREATLNAAKWSGADAVSLFAEVEPDAVTLCVRDTGRGFDPDAIAPDRQGIARSIVGRMAHHGGSARLRSAPGRGTEVELRLPRRSVAH